MPRILFDLFFSYKVDLILISSTLSVARVYQFISWLTNGTAWCTGNYEVSIDSLELIYRE